jgi:hypothetical protein
MTRQTIKILLALFLVLNLSLTHAQTLVQINGISLHDRAGYNGVNYGAGLEQVIGAGWSAAAGWYYNSESRGSTYVYGRYAVYKKDSWDIGMAVGAVTGYNRAPVLPMAFPEACYGWVCAMFVPRMTDTGASAVGFRLRIPVN